LIDIKVDLNIKKNYYLELKQKRQMVLAELGKQIQDAFKKLNKAQVIDEKLLDEIMKEICNALMNSDVNIKYVMELRKKVTKETTTYIEE